MRSASAALSSFLLGGLPWWSADLVTFTLTNGTTLRLASGDTSIFVGATLFVAAGPAFTRKQWAVKNTIEVPTMDLELLSTGSDGATVGLPNNVKLAIHNGLLDGAWIELDRAFMPSPGDTSLGTVPIFAGRAGQVDIDAAKAKIQVRGANVLMQQYMPKNRFMTGCLHHLYDAGCTMLRSSFTFTGRVASATSTAISWTADPTGGAFANLGQGGFTLTSGAGAGQTRTIGSSSSTGVTLVYPLYVVPTPGDLFTVTYGCDKTMATCAARFNNLQHFRGFPFIPPAEAAIVA